VLMMKLQIESLLYALLNLCYFMGPVYFFYLSLSSSSNIFYEAGRVNSPPSSND
jgi:hypothetical protein